MTNSVSRALCLRPAHLPLHLLQELGQQLVDGVEGLAVPLLGEGQVVEHVVMGDCTVNLEEQSLKNFSV